MEEGIHLSDFIIAFIFMLLSSFTSKMSVGDVGSCSMLLRGARRHHRHRAMGAEDDSIPTV